MKSIMEVWLATKTYTMEGEKNNIALKMMLKILKKENMLSHLQNVA